MPLNILLCENIDKYHTQSVFANAVRCVNSHRCDCKVLRQQIYSSILTQSWGCQTPPRAQRRWRLTIWSFCWGSASRPLYALNKLQRQVRHALARYQNSLRLCMFCPKSCCGPELECFTQVCFDVNWYFRSVYYGWFLDCVENCRVSVYLQLYVQLYQKLTPCDLTIWMRFAVTISSVFLNLIASPDVSTQPTCARSL